MESPYRPGFGARPAVVVGRERQLNRAHSVLNRVANSGQPSSVTPVFVGSRGLGKTVTLGLIRDAAQARGFVTASISCDSVSPNVQMIASQLASALAPLGEGTRATPGWNRFRERLSALSVEVNAGIVKISGPLLPERQGGTATQRQILTALLIDGSRLAADQGKAGLALDLDELQEPSHDDLVVIANSLQDALKDNSSPLAIFGAGLPTTAERVMTAASFTERLDFRTLKPLTDDEATLALLQPALDRGVRWDPEAANAVIEAAGGSPYLLQLMGNEIWTAQELAQGDLITPAAAEAGLAEIAEGLESGMFRGRWAKATPAEQVLLVAIAQVADADGWAQTRHISLATGRTPQQLSTARQSLIDKGLIEPRPQRRGALRFTMPGFDEYVLRLTTTDRLPRDELDTHPRPTGRVTPSPQTLELPPGAAHPTLPPPSDDREGPSRP